MTGYVYLILHEDLLVDIFVSTQSLASNALDLWIKAKLCPCGYYQIAKWSKGPDHYERGEIEILDGCTVESEVF